MSAIEHYAYGITREWNDDHSIVIVATQGDMARGAIDTWADVLIETIKVWDTDKPILVLHDLSHRNQGLSQYSRQRAEELYNYIPVDKPTYAAIVISDGLVSRLISIFFVMRWRGNHIHERIFTNRKEALAWLNEQKHAHE
ncbi:MAG: hypothetical protein MUF87_00210 [Anaerolineae bacterium]|jgi:hypothetical protein|nr:hypothetical protein [Anaerolineae bacterium]